MNGFIKVLEEIGADKQKDLDAAAKLREQLKEALALLEMVKDCCADEPRERVRAFLSRAPAQPESTQAGSAAGAKYFDWDRTPAQVAAPAAEAEDSHAAPEDGSAEGPLLLRSGAHIDADIAHEIRSWRRAVKDGCRHPMTLNYVTVERLEELCTEPFADFEPAAPTAEQAFEDGLDGSDWTKPPKPAAPTLCHPTDPCRHGITGPCSRCQPAAPAPSADTENPDYCRGYTDGVNDGVREILSGKERADKLAVAIGNVTKNLDWHARAESAEAQLAAVRTVVADFADTLNRLRASKIRTGMQVPYHDDFASAVPSVVKALERLSARLHGALTAPSPGEGKETL